MHLAALCSVHARPAAAARQCSRTISGWLLLCRAGRTFEVIWEGPASPWWALAAAARWTLEHSSHVRGTANNTSHQGLRHTFQRTDQPTPASVSLHMHDLLKLLGNAARSQGGYVGPGHYCTSCFLAPKENFERVEVVALAAASRPSRPKDCAAGTCARVSHESHTCMDTLACNATGFL